MRTVKSFECMKKSRLFGPCGFILLSGMKGHISHQHSPWVGNKDQDSSGRGILSEIRTTAPHCSLWCQVPNQKLAK